MNHVLAVGTQAGNRSEICILVLTIVASTTIAPIASRLKSLSEPKWNDMSWPQKFWRIVILGSIIALTLAPQSAQTTHAQAITDDANASTGRTILPTGWRRTTRGWERAEAWVGGGSAVAFPSNVDHAYQRRFASIGGVPPETLSQWMAWDKAREPVWANKMLGTVRTLHPLVIAVLLVAVAILITRVSEPRESRLLQ